MKCGLFLILSLFVITGPPVSAQQPERSGDQAAGLFTRQRVGFPQEKAYLQFDRNHYVAGDTVWFRGYLVDAALHIPDTVSRYLYVDLIDPGGEPIRQVKIHHRNGAYAGYIPLPEDIPEGHYTLAAFSMFMQNSGPDYLFRAPARISDPLSVKIETDIAFLYPSPRRLTAELRFRDRNTGETIRPGEVKMRIGSLHETPYGPTRDGIYTPSFRLPATSAEQNHLLIEYDRSRRYIEIPPPDDEFDVSFFPEGGHLISGAMCVVGIKALNPDGLSGEVSGELFDAEGTSVTTFETQHKGMGRLSFIPEAGKSYYAVCTNRHGYTKRFVLPEVRKDRVGLRFNHRGKMAILSVVRSPGPDVPSGLSLVVHSRGIVYYEHPIEDQKPAIFEKETLPSGVSHALLLDGHGNILSERLFFCMNDDQARLALSSDRPAYGYRQRVRLSAALTDPDGNPLSGSFSVAVTDDKDLLPDTTRNILTDLLLTSELRGNIDFPAYYLRENDFYAADAVDILMLTQGWRRYDIPAMLRGEIQHPGIPLEMGTELSGRVKSLLSPKPSVNTPVYLFVPQTGSYAVTETDAEGRFNFSGIEFPDSSSVFIQSVSRRGNDRVEMILDELPAFILPDRIPSPLGRSRDENDSEEQDYIAKADRKWTIENGMRTIHMDAVQVTVSKQARDTSSPYSGLADKVYDSEFLEQWNILRLEQVLSMTAGVQVDGDRITIRGISSINSSTQPVFVVDDMMMPDDFDWQEINMHDVERVEVIKGAMSAMFGMRGGNGAILIYTKKGGGVQSERVVFNRKLLTPQGYQQPAEFYSPKYGTTADRNRSRPDLRTTLYWNPNVRTGENGEATFDFYTADDSATTYSVVIEGVTDDGLIIRTVGKIIRE